MKMPFLMLFSALLCMGCATSRTVDSGKISVDAIPAVPEIPQTETESALPAIQQDRVNAFAQRVEWPAIPETGTPAFNIQSGTGDNVWIEGKGYFRGSLDQVYADLTDASIIGPTHMTKDIVRDDFKESHEKTTYVMHVKMKYIFSIEFDLAASLQPIYDGETQVGWFYKSDKTSGTRFIKMISDTLVIRQLENGWFSVEMQSLNVAAQDKEEEARGHIEALFDYWNTASQSR